MQATSIFAPQSSNLHAQILQRKKAKKPRQQETADREPGWYWRTPEGQRLIEALKHVGPDPLDDPSFDDRGEED